MTRIDNAQLVYCCIGQKGEAITSICIQKPNPKVHPGKGKGGRKMARIDNTRLVCCCIELESRIYCEHLHAKTKPQGAPWEGGMGEKNGKN